MLDKHLRKVELVAAALPWSTPTRDAIELLRLAGDRAVRGALDGKGVLWDYGGPYSEAYRAVFRPVREQSVVSRRVEAALGEIRT